MSDDFTTRLRQVAGLKEGCDPSTANILLGCAEYIERLQRRDVFDDGTITHMGRQARTIRRLFTAYFLAKAKANRWRKLYQHLHSAMGSMDAKAEDQERARIVAALRTGLPSGDPDTAHDENTPRGYGCVCIGCVHRDVLVRAADAIERGEL